MWRVAGDPSRDARNIQLGRHPHPEVEMAALDVRSGARRKTVSHRLFLVG